MGRAGVRLRPGLGAAAGDSRGWAVSGVVPVTWGMPAYVAAFCAGAAVWLVAAQDRVLRRARGLVVAGVQEPEPVPPWVRWVAWIRVRARAEWWCLAVGALVGLAGRSVLPLILGGLAVPLVGRVLRGRQARRTREARAERVIALCAALASEVRAGRQPSAALSMAARDTGGLGAGGADAAVLAAARFGGDVPDALRAASGGPGAEGLAGLAACWQVAVDRGAGLAEGLDRLAAALRAERDQQADLQTKLAPARATAAMLAVLPVVGLLMGTALGADPLRVLLHTPAGVGCLVVGGALEGAGLWWTSRIVRRAEGGRLSKGEDVVRGSGAAVGALPGSGLMVGTLRASGRVVEALPGAERAVEMLPGSDRALVRGAGRVARVVRGDRRAVEPGQGEVR
ncbi:type II secretion system F family protein [Streptomyces sp. TRM66268-LWL]|uniref:Type II secretion system F family protein n=1 Tax=Streptomyces polyasparticus TaxID=2767826 RepID=A0ABR7SK19_9ACTN|nr:type II secretion system F family protein [Streptomyces polyasparticus]